MIRTVYQFDIDIRHGIAGYGAVSCSLYDAFFDRRYILLRNHSSDYLVHKDYAARFLSRRYIEDDVAVLPPAARLLYELTYRPDRALYGLFVCHARPSYLRLDVKLPRHPVYQYLKMKLAHPADNRLGRLFIISHYEGRILLLQSIQGESEPLFVRTRLRLYGHGYYRLGEANALQYYRVLFGRERIARSRLLEADACHYVARRDLIHYLLLIGM